MFGLYFSPSVRLSVQLTNVFTLSHQISLENDYLGPRRIEALKKEDSDWQKKAQEAVLNIQEFTVKYFEITAKAQKGTVHLITAASVKSVKLQWTDSDESLM